MKRIKVAQIGTGEHTHSTQVFRSLINNPDVFDVVGFANVDHHDKPLQSVFAGHKEWTAEEILNMKDLDAVVIECDEELQTHYALLAAERGATQDRCTGGTGSYLCPLRAMGRGACR